MGAFSWKGLQPSDSRYGWTTGAAKAPGLRQAGSHEAGRVPFLSSQVHGAHDYVDPAWEGQEGGTGYAEPATSGSVQNVRVSTC